jgi:hypothetical protein
VRGDAGIEPCAVLVGRGGEHASDYGGRV